MKKVISENTEHYGTMPRYKSVKCNDRIGYTYSKKIQMSAVEIRQRAKKYSNESVFNTDMECNPVNKLSPLQAADYMALQIDNHKLITDQNEED